MRTAKLISAIKAGDIEAFNKVSAKYSAEQLDQQIAEEAMCAPELAINHQQPLVLRRLLQQGCNPETTNAAGQPLLWQALQQPKQALALISELLQAGADCNRIVESPIPTSILQACFEYSAPDQLMLHISRLHEFGASVDDPALLELALKTGRQDLLHLLVNIDTPLPDGWSTNSGQDPLISYACKCAEDRRVRQMFHQGL